MSERNARYIESGYHPDDGLGYGHWEQGPNGIQRWVGELESAKSCATCPRAVSVRATYCGPCKTVRDARGRQKDVA